MESYPSDLNSEKEKHTIESNMKTAEANPNNKNEENTVPDLENISKETETIYPLITEHSQSNCDYFTKNSKEQSTNKDLVIAGSIDAHAENVMTAEEENVAESYDKTITQCSTTFSNDKSKTTDVIKEEKPEGLTIDSLMPKTQNLASVFLKTSKLYQNNSLRMLASQYMSDSETDCELKSKITIENVKEESSDSSDSDIEFIREIRNKIRVIPENDDENDTNRTDIPKVKGEMLVDDLPPVKDLSDLSISEKECVQLGKVHLIVGQLVLIDSSFITIPLDLDTILFRNNGKNALGEIFDVLGPVSQPLYCVRFNNNNEIQEKGIYVGEIIYVAPRSEYTKYIILSNITKVRGSDASWENDIEPPERYVDYSDDEEERTAHRMMKKMHLQ